MAFATNLPEIQDALLAIADRHDGKLTAADVVKAAKPKRSVLHEFFTWDDTKAARLYREEEGRHLIRRVRVRVIEEEECSPATRAWINVEDDERSYQPVEVVVASPDLRAQTVQRLRVELTTLRHRLDDFEEFAEVSASIGKALAA